MSVSEQKTTMSALTIRSLEKTDTSAVRRAFTSGVESVDRYFHEFSSQNHFAGLNKTHVAVVEGVIVGFVTTAIGSAKFPKGLHFKVTAPGEKRSMVVPNRPQTVLLVAQLGVLGRVRGKGVAPELMGFALARARDLRDTHGCVALTIDPLNAALAEHYEKRYGFRVLDVESADSKRPPMMFLGLEEVEAIDKLS